MDCSEDGYAIYSGRGWAGDEPLCPICVHLYNLQVTPNFFELVHAGHWVPCFHSHPRLRGRITDYKAKFHIGCAYTSNHDDEGECWEADYRVRTTGIDIFEILPEVRGVRVPAFPELDASHFYTIHPDTKREILLPKPHCLLPSRHCQRQPPTVVLALPAAGNPSNLSVSKGWPIDDKP
jgi:hypothetical protein